MHSMTGDALGKSGGLFFILLAALLMGAMLSSTGCERSQPAQPGDSASNQDHQIPFHAGADQSSSDAPSLPSENQEADLPFRGALGRTLPAGTLMIVQLKSTLSGAKLHPGDIFTALVATPVSIGGEVVVERGAIVSGRIESIRSLRDPSGLLPDSGYVRMSLSAVTIAGRQVPLQTSSLFARGIFGSGGVRIPKGRDLTFRLTAAVSLEEPNLSSNRLHSPYGSE